MLVLYTIVTISLIYVADGFIIQNNILRVPKSTLMMKNTLSPGLLYLASEGKYSGFFKLLTQVPEVMSLLDDDGEFTIFAPNAEAFAKLDKKISKGLRDPRNGEVVEKVAAYHVVRGIYSADDIVKIGEIQTVGETNLPLIVTPAVSGGFFGFGGKPDGYSINGNAKIISSIQCSNCIIHEVNGLVNPYLLFRFLDAVRLPGQ
jgi:uncharacterized surface protein with fasciclin (FAS1) repeats